MKLTKNQILSDPYALYFEVNQKTMEDTKQYLFSLGFKDAKWDSTDYPRCNAMYIIENDNVHVHTMDLEDEEEIYNIDHLVYKPKIKLVY